MERDSEIILAASSIRVHLPALLGDGADRVRAELDALLAEWGRQPDPSVIDRIMVLLTGDEITREWVQDFFDAGEAPPVSSRGDDVGEGYSGGSGDHGDGDAVIWHEAPDGETAAGAGSSDTDGFSEGVFWHDAATTEPPGTAPAQPPPPATAPASPPAPELPPATELPAGAPSPTRGWPGRLFRSVGGGVGSPAPRPPGRSALRRPTPAPVPPPATTVPATTVPATTVPATTVPTTTVPTTAYGLLECPATVAVGREFELTVGLSEHPGSGVSGPALKVPPPARASYTLTVMLLTPGFRLRESETPRLIMQVSAADPYPSVTLHLTPDEGHADDGTRRIRAQYAVDGQPVGFAVRYVTVAPDASLAAAPTSSAEGVNLSIPAAPAPADLSVTITVRDGSDREIEWRFESPHALDLPTSFPTTDIGRSPRDFARDLTNQMSVSEGQDGVFQVVRGKGRRIREKMPPVFWDLFEEAAACTAAPPTILFITDEPYIPWELALVPDRLLTQPQPPPFLCAYAQVGRWLQPDDNGYDDADSLGPIQPPPTRILVDAMAVVAGVYDQIGQTRLKEAEAECGDLAERYCAAPIDARVKPVGECIDGIPKAEILHFAVHGKWDQTGAQDGLILVDGTLYPDQVEGGKLAARPLVFLNACQVGQGSEVLGDYAGIAAAFLRIGASAVVAPLWSIDDVAARSIALEFYRATLDEGVKPAEVIRRSRARFKPTRDKQSSTYLAYQFFGDPALELVRGLLPEPSPSQPPE